MNHITDFFRNRRAFYAVLLIGMLFRTFPFGFTYFPILDDHSAYGIFALHDFGRLWQDVVIHYNLFAFRPLAGLADAFIISRFWNNMAWVLIAIMILQFLTIFLIDKICQKSNIYWSRMASVFFAFFPSSTEAAYWINASSRIVVSAFFAVLAGYALLQFLYQERGRRVWLVIMLICSLLAQGYYEQGVIFAFIVTSGLLILHRDAIPNKWIFLWPFASLALIGIHYFIFRNTGDLSGRAALAPDSFSRAPQIAERIIRTFRAEQWPTIENTLDWGLASLDTWMLIVIAALAIIFALFIAFEQGPEGKVVRSLMVAAAVIVAPLSLFFVLYDSWVWVRNFYYSLIGLGFVVTLIFKVSFDKGAFGERIRKATGGVVCAIVVFMSISGFVLEVRTYETVGRYDAAIAARLGAHPAWQQAEPDDEVWLFGTRWLYGEARLINPRQASAIRMDWALNGFLGAITQQTQRPWVTPVMNGGAADFDADAILFGLDADLQVRLLNFDGRYLIFADDGRVFGEIVGGVFRIGN